MKYFAYGSNMSLPRIRARLTQCDYLGVYRLEAHSLKFHKSSQDGSAKCDAFFTGSSSDYILGTLYEIDEKDKQTLDCIEGLGAGYNEKSVSVMDARGRIETARIYYATHIENRRLPFDWYHYHVITGAREARLPVDYIASIVQQAQQTDPDRQRFERELAIYKTELNNPLNPVHLRRSVLGEEDDLRQLFFNTIHHINRRDYSQRQIEAWAPPTYDKTQWQSRVRDNETFIALIEQQIVGYCLFKLDGYIDHFYCHHEFQGRGIGHQLLETIFTQATARNLNRLYTHASITAKPFFERYGFSLEKSQQVTVRGQALTNFVLSKSLD
jgi:GNAT superfamily N-acetyltransferase